jgi:hypothetical protein
MKTSKTAAEDNQIGISKNLDNTWDKVLHIKTICLDR